MYILLYVFLKKLLTICCKLIIPICGKDEIREFCMFLTDPDWPWFSFGYKPFASPGKEDCQMFSVDWYYLLSA